MDTNKARNIILGLSTAKGAAIGIACIGLVIIGTGIYYAANMVLFIVTSIVGVYAFSIAGKIYSYDYSVQGVQDVIPEKDRELLTTLIKNNNNEGLELYIKISSLYGFTGNITKLGLFGLPLLTVSLTILFTILAAVLWYEGQSLKLPNVDPIVTNIMDLAKLTLGAFIGSFVQRSVSERAPEARPQSLSTSSLPVKISSTAQAQNGA